MPLRKSALALSQGTALDNILSLMWVLVCVLAIIALAYLFTRYVAGRGGMAGLGMGGGTDRFKALARLPVGREQSVVLVQAGGRYLLLGVAPAGVTLLTELTQEEAQALYAAPGQPAPHSFGEALRTVLKQKKQR